MFRNEIEKILKMSCEPIKEENLLPDNSRFLSDGSVLCEPRKEGDSRYPYYNDGLVMFCHTNGYIDCSEGKFNIFRTANYNEDTVTGFFAGEKCENGFFPYSVTGAAKQLFEGKDVKRYTVFYPSCAYYITETDKAVFSLRAYVTENKTIRFTLGALNKAEVREIYLVVYLEAMLRYIEAEGFFNRMTKYSKVEGNGFILRSLNTVYDCMGVRRSFNGKVKEKYSTTARGEFLGYCGHCLANATSLAEGKFEKQISSTNTSDLPVASDIVHFEFGEDEFVSVDYEMLVTSDEKEAKKFVSGSFDSEKYDSELENAIFCEHTEYDNLKIKFNSNELGAGINGFLEYVKRQVSLCALGKNYAGNMLGIRDVFQQLESSLLWHTKKSRKQIVEVLNYILEDGRPPRQTAFLSSESALPDMDLRPYIDQGLWIIETIYTYLAYTDDYSILDEVCTYYKAENTMGPVLSSQRKDSVLEHMVAICDFLISKIDRETNCLRALYGDWNDALDGIGRTKDLDKEFGSGCSVMATAQLYAALDKAAQILEKCGKTEKAIEYKVVRAKVAEGFVKNAVVEYNGSYRVLHGWGDKREYYIGSPNDYDGKNRISITSHAYSAISGLVKEYPEISDSVAENILSLDSKYGLITFNEPFYPYNPCAGRISTITPGTYENSAAYVHASTFGIMALFLLGRGREAWEQFAKSLTINHPNATKTTFVMPNSYGYCPEYNIDGVSMGDWYTGSGTVVIKETVKYGFGVEPELNGLNIHAPSYFPTDGGSLTVNVKGKRISIMIEGKGEKLRDVYADGVKLDCKYDSLMKCNTVFIPSEELTDGMKIEIK